MTLLFSTSSNKTRRQQQSYELHQLSCKAVELDHWLDRVERDLGSEDHGSDVQSAESLIKKHEQLRAEIEAKASSVAELAEKVAVAEVCDGCGGVNYVFKFQKYANHEEHLSHCEAVRCRYASLAEPCTIRAENLAEARRYFGWAEEADEQLCWLADKLPTLRSTDVGASLHAAQSLHNRHVRLQQELAARRPAIEAARATGSGMLDARHCNAADVEAKLRELTTTLATVERANEDRTRRLDEALRAQQYYAEAAEAESWCNERWLLVAQQDTGANQSAADAHLRRVTALEAELQTFETEVRRLRDMSDLMIADGHTDAAKVGVGYLSNIFCYLIALN